jgi:hypothetical protein
MFGGVNDDSAAGQPADQHQVVPADGALDGDHHAVVDDNAALVGPNLGYTPAADDGSAIVAPATDVPVVSPTDGEAGGDLLSIKQQALQELSPLVGHLQQSPEEKFRTTMMLIQASDNSDLIKEAYESAQQIPDEKARAQALLDIVNEINYFTQHQEQ